MTEQARQARRLLGLPTGEIAGCVDRILTRASLPQRVAHERRGQWMHWAFGLLPLAIFAAVALTEVIR